MGRWFSTCFLLGVAAISCLSSSASASDPDIVPFSKKFPVSIPVLDRSEVHRIRRLNIDVDAVGVVTPSVVDGSDDNIVVPSA